MLKGSNMRLNEKRSHKYYCVGDVACASLNSPGDLGLIQAPTLFIQADRPSNWGFAFLFLHRSVPVSKPGRSAICPNESGQESKPTILKKWSNVCRLDNSDPDVSKYEDAPSPNIDGDLELWYWLESTGPRDLKKHARAFLSFSLLCPLG